MTTEHYDFDADAVDSESPCAFRLAQREWHCRHVDEVPFAAMQELLAADGEAGVGQLNRVATFFETVLAGGEGEDFRKLLEDKSSGLSVGKLRPVIEYVSLHVFGRPTEPPESSQTGRQETESASSPD